MTRARFGSYERFSRNTINGNDRPMRFSGEQCCRVILDSVGIAE